MEKANSAEKCQLKEVGHDGSRALLTRSTGFARGAGRGTKMNMNPKITQRLTSKGELYVLTKPGMSMRMFLNHEELQALRDEIDANLLVNNLTH